MKEKIKALELCKYFHYIGKFESGALDSSLVKTVSHSKKFGKTEKPSLFRYRLISHRKMISTYFKISSPLEKWTVGKFRPSFENLKFPREFCEITY